MLPRDRDPQAADIAQYAHWGAFILSPDGRRLTKTHESERQRLVCSYPYSMRVATTARVLD
eukprot:30110-Eustigmatos_ZCMA.PRE.1